MPDASEDLIERWIEPSPYRPCADEARLREYGVAVWALVGYFQAVGDLHRVAEDYDLPVEAVQAALAYFERHRPAIAARIAANRQATAAEYGQLLC